jgi:O-antigen ligase
VSRLSSLPGGLPASALLLLALLVTGFGLAASPLLAAGAVLGVAVIATTLAWPLVVVAIMLALGPINLAFLTGGERQLLPALGGLDMSGIRLVAISGAIAVFVLTRRDLVRGLASPAIRWYVLFLVWAAATLAFSPDPLEGLRLLLKLSYPLLFFVVASAPERTPAEMRRLVDWSLWGAVAILLVNPLFVANGAYAVERGEILRVSGPGALYNPFSFYLVVILLLCVARFRSRGEIRYLLLATAAALWMVLTLTRITFLALFAALLVAAIYTSLADRNFRSLAVIAGLGALITPLVLEGVLVRTFGYRPTLGQLLALTTDPMALFQAINWQGRETLWGVLAIAFRQSPIVGSGLGASNTVLVSAQLVRSPHNEYFRLAVDVGLVGCTLFFLAVVAWVRVAIASVRRSRRKSGAEEFTMPALALMAAWALIAVTDNAFDYYAPLTQYVGFLVGACVVVARHVTSSDTEAALAVTAGPVAPVASATAP